MADDIRVRHAQIIGRMHLFEGVNMQDAMYLDLIDNNGQPIVYGVICDGCSQDAEGHFLHSEVGANLGVEFLSGEMRRLLMLGFSLQKIPPILHRSAINFLQKQVAAMPFGRDPKQRIRFIVDKLLFTVIGFIYTQEQTLIFYQGDGVFVVNDDVTILDQNDRPTYLGYSAIDRIWLPAEVSKLPEHFETVVIPGESLVRFAIASDSLGKEKNPDFFGELWGHKMPIGLQRRVNVWSLNEHKFQDDLSIITLEKNSFAQEVQT